MRHLRCSAILFAATAILLAAPAQGDDTEAAKIISQHADPTTMLAGVMQADDIRLPATDVLARVFASDAEAGERAARQLRDMLEMLQRDAAGQPVHFVIGAPISRQRWSLAVVRRRTSDEADRKAATALEEAYSVTARLDGEYLVVVPKDVAPATKGSEKWREAFRARVEAALKAAGPGPIKVAAIPPDYLQRAARELLPELPAALGGGPSEVLIDGVQWIALGLEPSQMRLKIVMQSRDATAAQRLQAYWKRMLTSLTQAAEGHAPQEVVQVAKLLVDWSRPVVQQSRLVMEFEGIDQTGDYLTVLAGLGGRWRQRSTIAAAVNNLKQIMLAVHNFHDVNGGLPPSKTQRDKKGMPRLSWRVHLLPFLGQMELYQRFHLDEPWDSEHNRELIPLMPRVFAGSDKTVKQGHTTLLAPVGSDTLFGQPEPVAFRDIRDGSSNTIAMLEVDKSHAEPWTAPKDFQYDEKRPLQGVRVGLNGRWLAAMADGSVHRLGAKLPAETVRRLFQRNDGKPVDFRQ